MGLPKCTTCENGEVVRHVVNVGHSLTEEMVKCNSCGKLYHWHEYVDHTQLDTPLNMPYSDYKRILPLAKKIYSALYEPPETIPDIKERDRKILLICNAIHQDREESIKIIGSPKFKADFEKAINDFLNL